MPVQTQLQQRRGTAASWTSTNPTLAAGEIGFETDTNKFKIGTGSTAWVSLAYASNVSPLTTKGDLYAFSTTNARLPVGANGDTIVADSSQATGLKWAAPAAAGMTNPMTTTGDLIFSNPNATPVRRGIGTTGQVLTVSGGVPTWASPSGGGKILQVVQGTKTTAFSTTSQTYVDAGLSVTITPSSASSRILVMFTGSMTVFYSASSARINGEFAILRDSTILQQSRYGNDNLPTGANKLFDAMNSTSYVDSPATTSATTYKLQMQVFNGTAFLNGQTDKIASIIVMEIGA